MNAGGPKKLTTDEAAALVVWAVETLAGTVGVEVEPVRTRQLARDALGARAEVSEEQLAQALVSSAAALRLELRPVIVDAASLKDAPLPLVACAGSGAVITARRGNEVFVHRQELEPRWEPVDAVCRGLGEGPHAWLTAVPAAPLSALGGEARDGHAHPSPVQRLWALVRLERDDLWVVAIYAVVVGLLTLATPIAVQALVSTVAFGTLLQPIVVLSLLLLAALGFQAALKALQTRVVESIQQRVFVRTAIDLAWRLPRVKREAADKGFGPETVNRFFDVLTVQKTANTLLTDGIATFLQIGIGLLVLGFYHPALLAFDLVLLALLTAVVFGPGRRGLATSIEESRAKYEVAAWLEELARPGSALRTAGGAAFAAERADALTRRYLEARQKHFTVLFGQTLGTLGLQVFASAALLGLGGWLVVQQSLTLGQLVAAELIVAAVAGSIGKLWKKLDAAYDLLTALDKLGHLVDLPIEDPERGEPVPGQGPVRVALDGAADGEGPALDADFPAGSRTAIVGAEGHPLGEWLTAQRVPARGVVTLNGVETSRARTPALREHLALVLRNDFFEGTVLENVTLGRVGVTAAVARAALERVGLLDEVRALPGGIDARLSHTGAPLTHSQLTRLVVARAIAGNPRLIVVDESLEAIEPVTRARVVAALTRPSAPWTLVALVPDAHVALARACNRVVTLEELARGEGPPNPEVAAS
ncbi:MAG: ATP-binding cassette domain-containing protein [Myxococcota bacterium]